jgi:hypothetical protein
VRHCGQVVNDLEDIPAYYFSELFEQGPLPESWLRWSAPPPQRQLPPQLQLPPAPPLQSQVLALVVADEAAAQRICGRRGCGGGRGSPSPIHTISKPSSSAPPCAQEETLRWAKIVGEAWSAAGVAARVAAAASNARRSTNCEPARGF